KMLRVAARSLVNKRRQQTARSWPNLAKIFGAKYPELFTQYAQSHSLPVCASPSGDGREFLRWMEQQEPLSDDARLEAMAFDLRWASTPLGLRRHGGFALKLVKLRETRGFVLAIRLPWLGQRWWRYPRK